METRVLFEKLKHNFGRWGIAALILVSCFCGCISYIKNRPVDQKGESYIGRAMSRFLTEQMERTYFMIPDFLENGESRGTVTGLLKQAMLKEMPIYYFAEYKTEAEKENEDSFMAEMIVNGEGTDEDRKDIEESKLDYEKDALHIENSMLEEMQKENSLHNESEDEKNQNVKENAGSENVSDSQAAQEISNTGSFSASRYPAYTYDWSENWNYETIVSNFYAVDNTTELNQDYVNLDKLLYEDLSLDKTVEGPQILIYHTHSQEDFTDSVKGDPSTTIMGAGEKLAGLLRDQYGFNVLHHTGEYDVENRDYAYTNALPAIEEVLKENPSIEVVIDLHRDEMKEGKKLVMDLQGRPTARFMFFDGLSHIRKKGDIDYLENPYIQQNLAFSFQAQVAANEYYPGLARKIYLKAYRYNLHLKEKSMLIELGAQTNTVEEIMNACDPIAHILAIVLDGML